MKKASSRLLAAVSCLFLLVAIGWVVQASSHREAPAITLDPTADNTDVYAFRSTETGKSDTVTIISNFIPLEGPSGGPNFHKFDDRVLYEIKIDNDGDAVEEITYQFRFSTQIISGATFLNGTGPITSLTDPNYNVRQTYSVTRATGRDGVGGKKVLGTDLPVPPPNSDLPPPPTTRRWLRRPLEPCLTAAAFLRGPATRVFTSI
jgi:hypothetical protein